MLVVGLTGGIASGKSLVSKILKSLGAYIIDADIISRELVKPGLPAYNEIVKNFGREVLLEDGTINRSLLGNIIFKVPEKRKILNSILHPRIIDEAKRQIKEIGERHPNALIVFDAALLIETGAHQFVDMVILVYVNEEDQINRLLRRDGISRKEALYRIKSQLPVKEKRKFADYIIDASGSEEDVRQQVVEIFQHLKNICKTQKRENRWSRNL